MFIYLFLSFLDPRLCRWTPEPRPGWSCGSVRDQGWGGISPGRRRETWAQSRAASRLHRRVSGPGLRLYAPGGPDRQLACAQHWRSVSQQTHIWGTLFLEMKCRHVQSVCVNTVELGVRWQQLCHRHHQVLISGRKLFVELDPKQSQMALLPILSSQMHPRSAPNKHFQVFYLSS